MMTGEQNNHRRNLRDWINKYWELKTSYYFPAQTQEQETSEEEGKREKEGEREGRGKVATSWLCDVSAAVLFVIFVLFELLPPTREVKHQIEISE